VDIAGLEGSRDPDSAGADSNPYSVQAGRLTAVADAGGNTLVGVDERRRRSVLAVFPTRLVPLPPEFGGGEIPMQAVPDAVVRGPKGDLYVGQLTGFPFPKGGASVWRVPARGGTPTVVAEGFTTIADIAVGGDGTLWVLELSANGIASPDPGPGRLVQVAPDGTRTVLADGLVAPTGLTVERGVAYVSNKGLGFGQGEVLRIRG
jgi:sugar lactone lactonase YvrE